MNALYDLMFQGVLYLYSTQTYLGQRYISDVEALCRCINELCAPPIRNDQHIRCLHPDTMYWDITILNEASLSLNFATDTKVS